MTQDMGAAAVEPLWRPRVSVTRGPKPALRREQIISAVVELADREGLDKVSMQRVAHEFGYSKMAIYRYFADKASLIAATVDSSVGDPPDLSQAGEGWRPRLVLWVNLLSECWRQHPWLPAATTGVRLMGPREAGWSDAALGAFAGTPLSAGERIAAISLLSGHVRHSHASDIQGRQPWRSAEQIRFLKSRGEDFSALLSLGAEPISDDGRISELGLSYILDGLSLRIDRKGRA